MENITDTKVLVLHVKKGYEDREQFINQQMAAFKIPFEYILDGDIPDITNEHLEMYFGGDMKKVCALTSCALKHLLACEKVVNENLKGALILEDDIVLLPDFTAVYQKSLHEAENRNDILKGDYFISYEGTTLEYIPKNKLEKNKVLYKQTKGRCAGAYYITNKVARKILQYTKENKCRLPLDWHHNEIFNKQIADIYWCHPAIAEQGSHSGMFKSSLDDKKHGYFQKIIYKIRKYLRMRK